MLVGAFGHDATAPNVDIRMCPSILGGQPCGAREGALALRDRSPCNDAQASHRATLACVHEPATVPISFEPGDEDAALVQPPDASDGTCRWCHGVADADGAMCVDCDENASALDGLIQPIIPITLYAKPSRMRDWLTFYKDDGDDLADPAAQLAIRTIVERFLIENLQWVSALRIDGALIVPSTLRRPPHPLGLLLEGRASRSLQVLQGLERTAAQLGHNRPNVHAFAASKALRGKRVLLLDDVYASGARAQSAAYALRHVGTEVAALLVIARRYNPTYSERGAGVFARQSALPFTWSAEVRDLTRTSGV